MGRLRELVRPTGKLLRRVRWQRRSSNRSRRGKLYPMGQEGAIMLEHMRYAQLCERVVASIFWLLPCGSTIPARRTHFSQSRLLAQFTRFSIITSHHKVRVSTWEFTTMPAAWRTKTTDDC
jgi:hypothetical protein